MGRCECKRKKRKYCHGKKQIVKIPVKFEKKIFSLIKELVALKKLKKNLMKKPKA